MSKEQQTALRPGKKKKIIKNYQRNISEFLSGKGYFPLTADELIKRLAISDIHQNLFHQALLHLEENHFIECKKGRYSLKSLTNEIVTGILRVHRRGFAFLQELPPIVLDQDVFIPKHLTKNAVDGDTVEILINTEAISEKGPEGEVINILKRGRSHMAGTITALFENGDSHAHVPLLGTSHKVPVKYNHENTPLREGDRIIIRVLEWGNKHAESLCEISHVLGHISDPAIDVQAAIEEFELRSDFSNAVSLEVAKIGSRVKAKDIQDREDLRDLETFTIDPKTAKDFDDALSLNKDKFGHYHLNVYIADVSHYVTPGTAINEEAKNRCNSTYFPGYCLPMIPKKLSEGLCSLKANVNRLVIAVQMQFKEDGSLVDYKIQRAVIRSNKRFTYEEAKNILDRKKQSKHLATLKLMVELCRLLKIKRNERGCIEFALPDAQIITDSKGVPTSIEMIEYDITHQLVEEFMIKANEIIATHLTEHGKDLSYRIHEEPSEDNFKDFIQTARAYGYDLPDLPEATDLQALFDDARQNPHGEYLATSFIRSMRLACYSTTNIGHYGLSLDYYCHFTSPIRRYADLAIHRQLFHTSGSAEDFKAISTLCSDQERISAKAEHAVKLLKKLRLLKNLDESNPNHQYEAVITQVKPFGFFFQIPSVLMEGFLKLPELENDYFEYEETKLCLRGTRTGITYLCGDKITVSLAQVNFITLESKWHLIADRKQEPKKRKKRTKHGKQANFNSSKRNQNK